MVTYCWVLLVLLVDGYVRAQERVDITLEDEDGLSGHEGKF